MEYTRDLGFYAAQYLEEGGSGVVVSIDGDHFKPLPFAENIDPKTGKTRLRMVDIGSERYRVARRYMIRLNREDFDDMHQAAKLAATAGISLDEFKRTFRYLVEREPPPIRLIPPKPAKKDKAEAPAAQEA
jgi:6-phosphofructokinase 1